MTLILIVIFVALVFEYINGFHDTANSIATVVSTKVLTPRQHATEAQQDEINQRMFEVLVRAARIRDRLQPLHQGTRHKGHTLSFLLQHSASSLCTRTSFFYKYL